MGFIEIKNKIKQYKIYLFWCEKLVFLIGILQYILEFIILIKIILLFLIKKDIFKKIKIILINTLSY